MANLCEICSNIPFLDLPPFPSWLGPHHIPISQTSDLVPFLPKKSRGDDKLRTDDASRDLGHPLHKSLDNLLRAAKTCELCSLISESVLSVKAVYDEAQQSARFTYYNKSGPPKYELFASKRRDDEAGFMVWSDSIKETEVFLLAGVGFCVDDESLLRDRIRGRSVQQSPSNQISLSRYQDWLKTCNMSHASCASSDAKGEKTTLPSRILDISDKTLPASHVKLVEPQPGTVAQYATLSHCWGESPQFITTRATLLSHKEGITLQSLPQTFQDAVVVARELGIRYLWIDSLCICQDDGSDWERESAKMADVYRNCHITIAATSSSSDVDGFLGIRPPRKHVALPLTMEAENSTASIQGEVKAFKIANYLAAGTRWYMDMKGEPLTKRAWALQERYLSPRTLHFGTDQTCFECEHEFLSEDGYRREHPQYTLTDLLENSPIMSADPLLQYRKGKRWYEVLSEYSTRELSRSEDKLPALSGMSRAFEGLMGGKYVAGLWEDCLIEGLAFQCFGKGRHTRPAKWRAPTWSWASVDGRFAVTTLGGAGRFGSRQGRESKGEGRESVR